MAENSSGLTLDSGIASQPEQKINETGGPKGVVHGQWAINSINSHFYFTFNNLIMELFKNCCVLLLEIFF